MKKMLLFAAVAVITFSCSKDDGGSEGGDYTIRIKSNSLAQMNLKGAVSEIIQTEGATVTTYNFNAAGNVTSILPGKGFVYDIAGRLTRFFNNTPGSLKMVDITYGTHDKYIYLDVLASEEAHFSPFVKGVESVTTVYGDEPSYAVTATYDVATGDIAFSRTGSDAEDYTGEMTFDSRWPEMPSHILQRGTGTFYFYYSETTGNLVRTTRDVPPLATTRYFSNDKYNSVSETITSVSDIRYRYNEAGDLEKEAFINDAREITYSYDYDAAGNWTSRRGSSGQPISRAISY